MAEAPNTRAPQIRLALSNTPPCVAVVHHLIAALAVELRLDALAADGLLTATGEASKNVSVHAYEGQEGPLEVEIEILREAVEVTVRDDGMGIRPHLGERRQPHNGLGLPIMHLLTRRLIFLKLPDGGTELRMLFELPGVAAPASRSAPVAPGVGGRPAPGRLRAVLASALCGALLPTLLPALALAAGLGEGPVLALLATELSSASRSFEGGSVTISAGPGAELRVEGLPGERAPGLVSAMQSSAPQAAVRLDHDTDDAGDRPVVVVAL